MNMVKRVKELVIKKINKPAEIEKILAEEFNIPLTIAEDKLEEIVKSDRTLQYIDVIPKGHYCGQIYPPGTIVKIDRRIGYHWEREGTEEAKKEFRRRRHYYYKR